MNTIESQLDPCELHELVPPPPQNTRERLKAQIEAEIRKWKKWLEDVEQLPGLENLDLPAKVFNCQQIDFDRLTHPDVVRVLQAVGGKWDKSITASCSEAIDYTQKVNGITIRLWAGEPPPNCKIVEEQVEIPAQPARIELKRVLRCNQ